MIRLLIVDDEEDLLWALSKNLFKDRKDVKIYTSSSGEEALKLLKRHTIDLLVADIRISGEVDGFNLISQAKDIVPRGKLIVMTMKDRSRRFEPSLGVAHYIEKPFDINNLRSRINDILDEGESYRGVMSDLALADIIALLCLSKRTALLHLNHRSRRGRLEVREGELIHAEFDGMNGHEAAWTMLGLQHGDIWFATDFKPYERSLEMSWEEVLGKAGPWLEENAWLVEEPEVDIPVEAWDEQEEAAPEPPPASESEEDDNFLGFTEDELAEMAMHEMDLPDFDAPGGKAPGTPTGPTEDSGFLPRTPRLAPESQQLPAPQPSDFKGPRPTTSPFMQPPNVAALAAQQAQAAQRPTRPGRAARSIKEVLAELKTEIPDFVAAELVHAEEGTILAGVVGDGVQGYDSATAAAFYGAMMRNALRAARAFGDASPIETVQITTDAHYILGRFIPGTSFAQLVTLQRSGKLGIALVVMRRFDAPLADALPS